MCKGVFSGIILISAVLCLNIKAQNKSVEDTLKPRIYTVSGYRHGISFFPSFNFKEVQYVPEDSLTFDRYHSEEVIIHWMRKWAQEFPDLVTIYEVGKSFEGRPILQMTLTNRKTGKDTDKPAAFFEGGRHSGEVTGTETVMYLAKFLLDNYGKDPEITSILDNRAIYLKPVNNPDGHNLYLKTAQSNRSTVRPEDNDKDGLLDEDAPEDLDGDGMILTMRWKDTVKGTWIVNPDDPTGRIMKRVPEGKGTYSTSSEGIDNDGDGKINEDGIGGLDLHRNYPENWRPETEYTSRGYTQDGSGEFPLSEPETKAVVLFLLSHPNIYVVNSMDTSVPMHLRPPSTSASDERMYPEDLKWYKLLDEAGKKITGYEKAGDVYNDYGNGEPLFGHGPDFGYFYFGAIWYGDEIWNGAKFKDYNKDGVKDQLDIIRWDDEENDSLGFFDWKPVKHPVYGEVEVGGFNPKFFSQNPPTRFLETWIRNEAMFNIEMIRYLPSLEWKNLEVKKVRSYKTDSADYQISISYKNSGRLPTALKQAQLVKIVKDDRVELEFDTTGFNGKTSFRIIEEKKNKETGNARRNGNMQPSIQKSYYKKLPFTEGGQETSAEITIRLYNVTVLKGKARIISTRAGILEFKDFVIK
jgi:hypothetical protein